MEKDFEVVSLDFPTRVTLINNGKEEGSCKFVQNDGAFIPEGTYVKIDFIMSIDRLKSLKGKSVLIKIPASVVRNDKPLMDINEDKINQISCSDLPGESSKCLTAREKEILDRIARGSSNRDIANALYISLHTVKTHVYNIFKKLNVSSRIQAALRESNGV